MKDASHLTAIACLAGLGGFAICYCMHVSAAGHMQHPPYGIASRGLDFAWPLAFILAAHWSKESRLARKNHFVLLLLLLVSTRYLLDFSGSLMVALLELASAIYLAWVSIALLRGEAEISDETG